VLLSAWAQRALAVVKLVHPTEAQAHHQSSACLERRCVLRLQLRKHTAHASGRNVDSLEFLRGLEGPGEGQASFLSVCERFSKLDFLMSRFLNARDQPSAGASGGQGAAIL
jgi:hypothetical protein